MRNNTALVAKAAKEFAASTILTTVAEKSFSGPTLSAIEHGGGYGLGLIYAKTMFGGDEGH